MTTEEIGRFTGEIPVCVGTAGFGSAVSREDSFAVMDAFLEGGGRFIDTAHVYASWIPGGEGMSERTVGAWVRERGVQDQVTVATKGAHPPLDALHEGRGSRRDIEQDLSESLERLGMDTVDFYWLHRDDPGRPAGELVETMAALVRAGRFRAWGVSNWTASRMYEALAYAHAHALPPFLMVQQGWALAEHATKWEEPSPMVYLDKTLRDFHLDTHVVLAAYSPQATGFLGEVNVLWAETGFNGPAPAAGDYDSPENRKRLSRAISLAREFAVTPNQIALAYLLHQPFAVIPIIGTGKVSRVKEALAAAPLRLTTGQVEFLTA